MCRTAFDNELNGVFPGNDGTLNTRANVHASVTIGDRLRVYGALKHGDVYGREMPALPVNRNRLDLHQAFVELGFGDVFGLEPRAAIVRVGRQEMHYGNGALISARLGPNVRSDYDGVLVRVRTGGVVSDAFVYRGVVDRFGVFDDGPDRTNTLWGSYTTIASKRANLDLIYVGQHRRGSVYAISPQPFDEHRHTLGLRLWTAGPTLGGVVADLEFDYQFGHARPLVGPALDISAWSVVGAFSYPLPKVPLTPAFGLEFGVNSGDRDPADGKLGTFRAPAPPGRYFGEANAFGPGNIQGLRPYVEIHPAKAVKVKAKATFFWRRELTDGTYSLAPGPLRGAGGTAHYLGVEPGLEVNWVSTRICR